MAQILQIIVAIARCAFTKTAQTLEVEMTFIICIALLRHHSDPDYKSQQYTHHIRTITQYDKYTTLYYTSNKVNGALLAREWTYYKNNFLEWEISREADMTILDSPYMRIPQSEPFLCIGMSCDGKKEGEREGVGEGRRGRERGRKDCVWVYMNYYWQWAIKLMCSCRHTLAWLIHFNNWTTIIMATWAHELTQKILHTF